jgi:hypothetical protein
LKPWAVDGKIACLRNGRLFRTNTSNVAIKTDFYRLREFTEQDLQAIQQLCLQNAGPELREAQRGWIAIFRLPFTLREVCASALGSHPVVDTLFNEMINNLEEDLHAHIEGASISHLEALRKGDLQFLDSDDELVAFLHFVSVQYLRTDKIRSATIAALKDVSLFDVERVWGLMSHLLATNVSHYLFMNRDRLRVSLVRVSGGAELITSDQPLINLRALNFPARQPPQEFEVYYPVSPTVALLLEADHPSGGRCERVLEPDEATRYNRAIFQTAHEQVFGVKEETLTTLRRALEGD